MSGVWGQLATAEDAATLASGLLNAGYFAHRAWHASGHDASRPGSSSR